MTVVICSKGGHQKASVTGSESKPHPSPPPPACLLFPSKAQTSRFSGHFYLLLLMNIFSRFHYTRKWFCKCLLQVFKVSWIKKNKGVLFLASSFSNEGRPRAMVWKAASTPLKVRWAAWVWAQWKSESFISMKQCLNVRVSMLLKSGHLSQSVASCSRQRSHFLVVGLQTNRAIHGQHCPESSEMWYTML